MKAADQDKNGTLDKNEFISFIKSRNDDTMSSRQRANLIHFSPSIFNFHNSNNSNSRSPLRSNGGNSNSNGKKSA